MYEITTTLRTLRTEGLGSLVRKMGQYFHQIFRALSYCMFNSAKVPGHGSVEDIVDHAQTAAQGLIAPGQVRSEIIRLANIVKTLRPQNILEIGTANGGTFYIWTQVAPAGARLISIDLPGGIHGGGYAWWRGMLYRSFRQPRQRVHLLRADSHDPVTLDHVKMLLQAQLFDFLFIDGDHSYAGVKKDFELYFPLLRTGGIAALHDICHHTQLPDCQVDKYWAEIKTNFEHEEIIETPGQGWAGIGLIYKK